MPTDPASKLAAVLLSSFFASAALAAGPTAAGKTIPVELGKEFRLEKGDVARIADGRAFLRIAGFVSSPCPKGARCVWSGQSVMPELTVDGKVVARGAKDPPYDVAVKGSDYRTYAVFVVDEPKQEK